MTMTYVIRKHDGSLRSSQEPSAYRSTFMKTLSSVAVYLSLIPSAEAWRASSTATYRYSTPTMTSSTVRFVTNTKCPYAQRTWIALEETGTTYEMKEISLYGPGGKPDWFMKLNPKGEVPVLVVDDAPIVGSEETVDFLMKDTAPPGNGARTGTSSRWRAIVNQKLKPVGKRAVFSGSSADIDSLNEVLRELEGCLVPGEGGGDGPFVCGGEFTAADASAFPFLQRLHGEFGFPEDCERLRGWYDSACRRPSVKKTIKRDFWWWW